jgi:hypothetical protein
MLYEAARQRLERVTAHQRVMLLEHPCHFSTKASVLVDEE